MMTDRFVLRDKAGNKIAEKNMVEHIKVIIDEMNPEPGQHFTVKSEVTGFELAVSDSTTVQDWREYADKCLMALD